MSKEFFKAYTVPCVDNSQVGAPKPVESTRIVTEAGLGVYVADGRATNEEGKPEGGDVAVLYPQWSDGTLHNPASLMRTEILAAERGNLVCYVDNPGVELDMPPMSKDIKQALASGDFSLPAKLQWDAIEQALDVHGLKFSNVNQLVGASLGAHMAAEGARQAPGDVRLSRLDLWETAGLKDQSALAFTTNYLAHGGDNWDELVKTNPEWAERCKHVNSGLNLARLALQRTAGLLYYPLAIHRSLGVDVALSRARKRTKSIGGDTTIVILNGSESKVSPRSENDELALRVARIGLKVMRLEVDGGVHASQDNLGWWRHVVRSSDAIVQSQS